jgi:hypothetical protein
MLNSAALYYPVPAPSPNSCFWKRVEELFKKKCVFFFTPMPVFPSPFDEYNGYLNTF